MVTPRLCRSKWYSPYVGYSEVPGYIKQATTVFLTLYFFYVQAIPSQEPSVEEPFATLACLTP